MKRFLASSLKVAALAFTFASTASAAVTTILADNFDHYDLTNAPAASTWTQAMSSGTHKWVSAGSPNSIAKAEARQIVAAPGREGNAFLYKEFATDATYPYIYSTLDEGILDATATWEFRIDFYVDQVENTNGYWLFALYGAPTRNSSDVIVRAQVRRNGSNIELGIPFKATPGGSTVTTQLQIAGQSWHTLTITGNNATQQFTMSLNGTQIAEGYYLNNFQAVRTVLLGDANSSYTAPQSVVLLDNFILTSIPEPASTALLLPATVLLAVRRLKK